MSPLMIQSTISVAYNATASKHLSSIAKGFPLTVQIRHGWWNQHSVSDEARFVQSEGADFF